MLRSGPVAERRVPMRFIRLCLFVGGVVMAMAWANRPVHAEGFFSKLFGWGSSRRTERTIEPNWAYAKALLFQDIREQHLGIRHLSPPIL